MDGISGIGYGFLRLAAPDRVRSVLMFNPPSRLARARPASLPAVAAR